MCFGRLCGCFCCGYPCIRKLLMSCPAAKDIWCFPHQVYDAGQKQALDSFKGLWAGKGHIACLMSGAKRSLKELFFKSWKWTEDPDKTSLFDFYDAERHRVTLKFTLYPLSSLGSPNFPLELHVYKVIPFSQSLNVLYMLNFLGAV